MAKRDVQLVIRARDEASRAVDTIVNSLTDLGTIQNIVSGSSEALSSDFGALVSTLAKAERAYGLVTSAADRGEASFKKQQATLAATKAELVSVETQIRAAGKAIQATQSAIVNTKLDGGDTTALVGDLKGAETSLKALQRAQIKLKSSINSQDASINKQRSSLQALGSTAISASAAMNELGTDGERSQIKLTLATEEANRALKEQAAAARELADQQRNQERFNSFQGISGNPNGAQASVSAQVFIEQQRLADSADKLRAKIDPVADIQNRMNAELREASALLEAGAIDAGTYSAALEAITLDANNATAAIGRTGKGAKARPAFLGLKPYELTNLGYQVNDIVTQLASGTAPMQVLAQQGGQVLQILPGIGKNLIAIFTNPAILSGIAVVATLGVIFKKASNDAKQLEKIEGFLEGIGDGARYSVAEMNEMVDAVDRLGVSAADALKIVQQFVREGLNTDFVVLFAQAADDTATVTGDKIPEAMEKLKAAFSGGFESVAKLDDKIQFLSVSEREQIKAMFESGQAAQARERAFRIYEQRMNKIANSEKGEWSEAFKGLTGALDGFFDKLSETEVIQTFSDNFTDAIEQVTFAINKSTGNLSLDDINTQIESLEKRIEDIKRAEKEGDLGQGATESLTPVLVTELNDLLEKRQEILKANAAISGDIRDEESAFIQKRRNDALDEIKHELELARATDDRQRIRLEGERAYREEIAKTGDALIATARKRAAIERLTIEARKNGTTDFQDPVDSKATSKFGNRKDPITGKTRKHNGRDFAVPVGTPVRAPAAGIVTSAQLGTGKQKGNGLFVQIDHGKGAETLLLHLSESEVVRGQVVEAGQVIGKSGGAKGDPNSGRSTGPHLHESRKVDGQFVDPAGSFETDGKAAEKAARKRIEDQDKFNTALDVEIDKRKASTNFQKLESELSGNALLDAQKKFEIDKAIAAKEAEAAKANLDFTTEQRKELEASLAAEFEIVHARERATALLDSSTTQRQALIERLGLAQQSGDQGLITALESQIGAVEEKMESGIKTAIRYFKTLNTPEASAEILKLESNQANLVNDRGARAANKVDRFSGERSALVESLRIARDLGETVELSSIEAEIIAVDNELRKTIDTAIAFYQQFNSPESRAAETGLSNLRKSLILEKQDRAQDLVEKPVNDLQSQRSGLQEQIEFFKELGQNNVVEELKNQLKEVDAALLGAIDKSIQFWQTQTGPEAEAALLQFQNLRNQILAAQVEFSITAADIQQAFAGSLSDSVQLFADRLVETKNPIRALAEAALNFAASFLQKIAEMLLQMAALKLASKIGFGGVADAATGLFNAAPLVAARAGLTEASAGLTGAGRVLTGAGVGLTTGAASLTASGVGLTAATVGLSTSAGLWLATAAQLQAAATTLLIANTVGVASGGVLHGGGIAGSANRSRSVHPAMFAGATRYHGGGIAGLKPNEVPTILERGEEVITKTDSRHRLNGGTGGGDTALTSGGGLSQILAIGDDEIANAMSGAAGGKVTLTHIKRHRETIRQVLRE